MRWPDEAEALFRRACREPMVVEGAGHVLDRAGVEALLPHRPPMLLVHQVTSVDLAASRLAATYPLEDGAAVLAGHFPGRPVWPGALQIEAIGQAAILLWALGRRTPPAQVQLTHVLGARFLRPVPGEGLLTIAVQGVEDGLFTTAVGQCLFDGEICSVAGVSCVVDQ